MARGKAPLKPPTAAGWSPESKKRRPAWLLQWAKANPGAALAAAISVAFVVVISVWVPLTPHQFARVRCGIDGEETSFDGCVDGGGRHRHKFKKVMDQSIDGSTTVVRVC